MLTVKSIMSTKVITVLKETPIHEALQLLSKNKISGMPVVDAENRVVGILSEKDVLRILVDKHLDGEKTVNDYMSREVVCFGEEDSPIDVCKFFLRSYIRRVPIIKDGKLVGIISRRDIVNVILEMKSKISDFRYV